MMSVLPVFLAAVASVLTYEYSPFTFVDALMQAIAIFVLTLACVVKLLHKPAPPAPKPKAEKRDYTAKELLQFNGTDESKPILIAIKGDIFDCSRGASFYGKDGPYAAFAGHDASRALAKSSVSKDDVSAEISDLTENEKTVLKDWYGFFDNKYPKIGRVI